MLGYDEEPTASPMDAAGEDQRWLQLRIVLCFAPAGSAVSLSDEKPLAERCKLSQVMSSMDSVGSDWLILLSILSKVEPEPEPNPNRFFTCYHGLQPLARPVVSGESRWQRSQSERCDRLSATYV